MTIVNLSTKCAMILTKAFHLNETDLRMMGVKSIERLAMLKKGKDIGHLAHITKRIRNSIAAFWFFLWPLLSFLFQKNE